MSYITKPISPASLPTKEAGYITLVYGDKGSGKTTFAIDTADIAQPLWFANFDKDCSALLSQYKGTEIYYERFNPTLNKVQATRECDRLYDMVKAASKVGGVFVIDGAKFMHNMVTEAYLPTKMNDDKAYPKEYGDVNVYHGKLNAALEDSTLWPIYLASATEIWKAMTEGTGLYTYDGWNGLKLAACVALYLFCPGMPQGVKHIPTEAKWPVKYQGQIAESKLDRSLLGSILDNPRFSDIIEACY